MVLQDFNGHDLIGSPLPALGHLTEGSPSQELEHLVAVGHGAEDLVLHQLVVALAVGVAALCGGGGMGDGLSRGGPASAATAAATATADPVQEDGSRELLQDLHAVAAVHLLALPLQAVLLLVQVTRLQELRLLPTTAGGGGGRRGRGRTAEAARAVGRPHHRWLVGAVGGVEGGAGGGGGRCLGGAGLVVAALPQLVGCVPGGVLHLQPLRARVGAGRHGGRGEGVELHRHVCEEEEEHSRQGNEASLS